MGNKIRRSLLGLAVNLSLGIFCRCSASEGEAQIIRCSAGWGSQEVERVIPPEWINDGYCDCPLDGLDEPETEACSGSAIGGWSGIATLAELRCVQLKIE